jgi:hypothetical protein
MVPWLLSFFQRSIFLAFDPHRSDCSQWEKDGRPGPHNHSNDLPMDPIPDLGFHLVRETAMETDRRDASLVIADRVSNPLGPFGFADDDENGLSLVERQANNSLQ